ncbi:hypothetical protein GGX14DRAFT_570063 [Mycena pura]|uniref:Uncharacterized protein n=1 Tax=Mycena pura TaxID=153505 RepID=A0AAD6Y686_9AGAR|nr:hypothetical protein GGX14DRAFT_570063 [Mycena pura]
MTPNLGIGVPSADIGSVFACGKMGRWVKTEANNVVKEQQARDASASDHYRGDVVCQPAAHVGALGAWSALRARCAAPLALPARAGTEQIPYTRRDRRGVRAETCGATAEAFANYRSALCACALAWWVSTASVSGSCAEQIYSAGDTRGASRRATVEVFAFQVIAIYSISLCMSDVSFLGLVWQTYSIPGDGSSC